MLVKKPRSGYALSRKTFEPLRPDISQIYRALAQMAKEGLVSFDKVEQDKLPPQKVYTVTPKGQKALQSWLRKPLLGQIERDPFLTQLWLSSHINKKYVINNIKAYADEAKKQMKWLQAEAKGIVHRSAEASDNHADEMYRNLVIDCDIALLKARVAWAEEAVKQIQELDI
jgi:DNA-binding PadR family transcriptional regulator